MLLRYDRVAIAWKALKLTFLSNMGIANNQTICARALATAALTTNPFALEEAQRPHPQLLAPAAKETAVEAQTDASAVRSRYNSLECPGNLLFFFKYEDC